MPSHSEAMSRRDSWPPTQVRLTDQHSKPPSSSPSEEARQQPLEEIISQDPLTYFLTPPDDDGDDDDDDDDGDEGMMFLDAGIEDPNHPTEPVRSVSPSSLSGLSRPDGAPPRPPQSVHQDMDSQAYMTSVNSYPSSPEEGDSSGISLSSLDSDEEGEVEEEERVEGEREEEEGYIYDHGRPRSRAGYYPPPPPRQFGRKVRALLSPSSSSSVASHPRRGSSRSTLARGRGRGGVGNVTAMIGTRRRPSHLWREPSPDVWSIEEEAEDEGGQGDVGKGRGDDTKSTKRVRFLLPEGR